MAEQAVQIAENRAEAEAAPLLELGKILQACLLYTSDAADERSSVDLGGRRIIKKKKLVDIEAPMYMLQELRARAHTTDGEVNSER